MRSRSNDRIIIICRVISELFGIDITKTNLLVIKTETGRAILNKNQIVLHDQATANIYEVIQELPSEVTSGVNWTNDDITRIYRGLIRHKTNRNYHFKKKRLGSKGKALLRRRVGAAKRDMKADIWHSTIGRA